MVLYLVLHLYQFDSLSGLLQNGGSWEKNSNRTASGLGFHFLCFFFRYCFNTVITPSISPSNILGPVCFFHLQMLQRQTLVLQMCLWFYLSHPVTSITCVTLGSPDIPLPRLYPALKGQGTTILSPVDHFQQYSLWYAADRSRQAGHARLQLAFLPVKAIAFILMDVLCTGVETVLLFTAKAKGFTNYSSYSLSCWDKCHEEQNTEC